jgi:hypothetical protein
MKKWEVPKLIVLVRGDPGESVLDGCKYHPVLNGDPNNQLKACAQEIVTGQCVTCEGQVQS